MLDLYPDVFVLLDDYASLITEAPYFSCLGPRRARWLCVRSFNKALSPDFRLAVATGDAEIIEQISRDQWLADGWVSGYLQRAASAAMKEPAVQKSLARAREVYTQRRQTLLDALAGAGIPAFGKSGLNVWIPVDDEAEVTRGLIAKGFYVRAGARYRLRSAAGIRVTAANLERLDALRLARGLKGLLEQGRDTRGP